MSTRSAVKLSEEERSHLELLRRGAAPARVQTRARVLLLSDRGRGERRTDEQVAEGVLTSISTAKRTRWRFLQEGPGGGSRREAPNVAPAQDHGRDRSPTRTAGVFPATGRSARSVARLLAEPGRRVGVDGVDLHVAVGNRLKKRNQALASKGVVRSQAFRGVRVQDGRRAGKSLIALTTRTCRRRAWTRPRALHGTPRGGANSPGPAGSPGL